MSSCSSEDALEETNAILPKSIKITNPKNPSENSVMTYSYQGKKLVSISENNKTTKFVYDGDKIIKEVSYVVAGPTTTKIVETTYKYSGKKMISSFVQTENDRYKSTRETVYTYNADGTVKSEENSKAETIPEGYTIKIRTSYKMTFVNGNLAKLEDLIDLNNVYENEFDDHNNPFKNVTGFDLLMNIEYTSNNLITNTYTFKDNFGVSGKSLYKVEYEYNDDGYPSKKTTILKDGSIGEISEYSY